MNPTARNILALITHAHDNADPDTEKVGQVYELPGGGFAVQTWGDLSDRWEYRITPGGTITGHRIMPAPKRNTQAADAAHLLTLALRGRSLPGEPILIIDAFAEAVIALPIHGPDGETMVASATTSGAFSGIVVHSPIGFSNGNGGTLANSMTARNWAHAARLLLDVVEDAETLRYEKAKHDYEEELEDSADDGRDEDQDRGWRRR